MLRNYRKPLVIASPKGLLRLSVRRDVICSQRSHFISFIQAASSSLADIEPGTKFDPVLVDPVTDKLKAKRVVMLAGKVYYELIKERQARNLNDTVALVRIEELAPFPFKELERVLLLYPNAKEFAWLQEEPRNQGAFTHVQSRILSVLGSMGRDMSLMYIGRKESSVPAPGVGKLYQVQQKSVIEAPFLSL